jgi:hypothetical protein
MDDDIIHVSEEQFENLYEKSQVLGKTISDNQISTQQKVTSFTGIDRLGNFESVTKDVLQSQQIRGKQLYVPSSIRSVKVTGNIRNSYVISEISHTSVFKLNTPVTHLTITNCSEVVIVITGTSLTGIECINSRDIVIDCELYNFVRTTTSNDCKLTGKCDDNTLFDIRNCFDIYVNGERMSGNMFTESRFKRRENKFEPLTEDEDFYGSPKSVPNLSLLKLW